MRSRALVIALLATFLTCGTVRAEVPGYVDTNRVRSAATEPVRADAQFRAGLSERNQKLNNAVLAAQKAKPADQAASWDAVRQLQEGNNKLALEVDATFAKRLGEILAKVRAERHVAITAGPGVILVPGVDLTAEVIRRWDESDAKGMADELARAKAENERLKEEAKVTTKEGTKK